MKTSFSLLVDPRLISIGFWGKVVFDELLRIDRDFEFNGTIPQAFCTTEYLLWRLNLKQSDINSNEGWETPRDLIKEQLAMLNFYGCIEDKNECTVLYMKDGE